jgi:hypothetical protein
MNADEHVKARLTPEGKFALLLILSELLVFAVALFFGKPELGLSSCISIGVLLIALRATWKLRNHTWYWVAVIVAGAFQLPLIFHFPWSNHALRGSILIALGLADFIFIWGSITLCGKLMNRG